MVLTFTLCLLGSSALLLTTAAAARGPTCPPPHIRYGMRAPAARYYYRPGDTVSFTCNPGYTLQGSRSSTCGADSRWNPPLPVCKKEVMCPRPPSIANGLHSGQSLDKVSRGVTVHYSCREGYSLVGNVSITCTEAGEWSRPLPRCEAIGCKIPTVQHGRIYRLQSTYKAGETLHFDCDDGYAAEGTYETRCQPGGTWDPPVLICQRVRPCPMPPEIPNGNYNSQGKAEFTMGMFVRYTCNPGYYLVGNAAVFCRPSGNWSQPRPRCEEVMCPRPPSIANGLHSGQSLDKVSRGVTVHYSCREGYSLVGNVSITCTEAGEWSRPLPRCEAIDCEVPTVQHGRIYRLQSTYKAGETLHFDCDDGYAAEGTYETRCQPGGTWDPPVLICQRVRPCPMPPEIPNGNYNGQGKAFFTMGMFVRYTCNPGYYLVGNAAVFCRPSGNWSQPSPRCEVTVCINPTIANGRQIGAQGLISAPGQTLTFQCHDGYSLKGSAKVSCQEDGSWQPPVPVCDRSFLSQNSLNRPESSGGCGPPTRLHFAELNEEHRNAVDFSVGKTVQYTCRPGYAKQPGMSPTITCLESGVWSEALEFCKRKQCKYPETPRNGRVVVLTDLLLGSTVSHMCEEGHRLVGQSHRRCVIFGRDVAWSGLSPICQKVVCPLPQIRNGRVTVLKYRYTYKDTVSFKCRKGFTMRGHHTSQCQADQTWDPPVPVCEQMLHPDGVAERYHHPNTTVLHCSKPADITHGSLSSPAKEFFIPGTSVSYICDPGFSLLGTASIYCTPSGAWSHPPPVCQAVKCFHPPNITNGKLKGNVSHTYPYGASVSYSCNPGYSLVGNASISCTVSGTWSQPLPQCREIRCEFPDIQGVKKAIKGNTYRSGTNITLECDDGYTLEGISQTQCQEDFSWDPPVPACKLTAHKSGSVGLGVAAAGVLLLLGTGIVWKIVSKRKEGYYHTYENFNNQPPLNPVNEQKTSGLP